MELPDDIDDDMITARYVAIEEHAMQVRRAVDDDVALLLQLAAQRMQNRLAHLDGAGDGRVQVIDPLSTKGLEWDATVVLDPDAIVEESPGGVRVLYVVLTRAAHRATASASPRSRPTAASVGVSTPPR